MEDYAVLGTGPDGPGAMAALDKLMSSASSSPQEGYDSMGITPRARSYEGIDSFASNEGLGSNMSSTGDLAAAMAGQDLNSIDPLQDALGGLEECCPCPAYDAAKAAANSSYSPSEGGSGYDSLQAMDELGSYATGLENSIGVESEIDNSMRNSVSSTGSYDGLDSPSLDRGEISSVVEDISSGYDLAAAMADQDLNRIDPLQDALGGLEECCPCPAYDAAKLAAAGAESSVGTDLKTSNPMEGSSAGSSSYDGLDSISVDSSDMSYASGLAAAMAGQDINNIDPLQEALGGLEECCPCPAYDAAKLAASGTENSVGVGSEVGSSMNESYSGLDNLSLDGSDMSSSTDLAAAMADQDMSNIDPLQEALTGLEECCPCDAYDAAKLAATGVESSSIAESSSTINSAMGEIFSNRVDSPMGSDAYSAETPTIETIASDPTTDYETTTNPIVDGSIEMSFLGSVASMSYDTSNTTIEVPTNDVPVSYEGRNEVDSMNSALEASLASDQTSTAHESSYTEAFSSEANVDYENREGLDTAEATLELTLTESEVEGSYVDASGASETIQDQMADSYEANTVLENIESLESAVQDASIEYNSETAAVENSGNDLVQSIESDSAAVTQEAYNSENSNEHSSERGIMYENSLEETIQDDSTKEDVTNSTEQDYESRMNDSMDSLDVGLEDQVSASYEGTTVEDPLESNGEVHYESVSESIVASEQSPENVTSEAIDNLEAALSTDNRQITYEAESGGQEEVYSSLVQDPVAQSYSAQEDSDSIESVVEGEHVEYNSKTIEEDSQLGYSALAKESSKNKEKSDEEEKDEIKGETDKKVETNEDNQKETLIPLEEERKKLDAKHSVETKKRKKKKENSNSIVSKKKHVVKKEKSTAKKKKSRGTRKKKSSLGVTKKRAPAKKRTMKGKVKKAA